MALAGTAYLRGESRIVLVALEAASAWGTYVAPVALGAIKVTEFETSLQRGSRVKRDDAKSTTGVRNLDTEGVVQVNWSLKGYMYLENAAAQNAAGAVTGFDCLLYNFYGVRTNGGGKNDFTPLTGQTQLRSLTILHAFADPNAAPAAGIQANKNDLIWGSELLTGCVVKRFRSMYAGPKKVEIEFSGIARRLARATRSATAQAGAGNSIVLTDDQASRGFNGAPWKSTTWVAGEGPLIAYAVPTGGGAGSYDDNTGAGRLVTAINHVTKALTVAGGAITFGGAGGFVWPWCPNPTFSGANSYAANPLTSHEAALTLNPNSGFGFGGGAIAMPFESLEIVGERDHQAEENQAGSYEAVDILTESERTWTGTVTVRSRHDLNKWQGARRDYANYTMALDIGPPAGRHLHIDAPIFELGENEETKIPKRGRGEFSIPFTMLESSGDDEMSFELW